MRRVVLIVPSLAGSPGSDSVLRGKLPSFSSLAELGELFKLAPPPSIETPEALYLGMRPSEAQLRQGPLTVAALGADPPERSTHFHLSVLSSDDGLVSNPALEIPPDEAAILVENAPRLNTRVLTFVKGEGKDHGLVWEGLGEMLTRDPSGFSSEALKNVLPEGDADVILRRYIDDSINLFSEMEFNLRRQDEGLPLFNVLWPWGDGVRLSVPNLALRRGAPAVVESRSLRLAGLSRLAGYRHGSRAAFGRGIGIRLADLASRLSSDGSFVSLIDAAAELREKSLWEELEWFVRELDGKLLQPLLQATLREPSRLTLLSPGSGLGLGVTLGASRGENVIPFDERALEEKSLPVRDLASMVDFGLTAPP